MTLAGQGKYRYARMYKETPDMPGVAHIQWHSGPYWDWNSQALLDPINLVTQCLEWAWNTGDRPAAVGSPQWYGVDPDYEAGHGEWYSEELAP